MNNPFSFTQTFSKRRFFYFTVWILVLLMFLLALPVYAQGPATETTIITATDGTAGDVFGWALDVDNGTSVVGARGANSGQGEVYILERNQGGEDSWGEVITLTNGAAGGSLGYSVSIHNDTLAVGAPGVSSTGAVYIFERNQGGADNWGASITLTVTSGAVVGKSVALSDDTLVVGAPLSNTAYIFERNWGGANNWGQVATLTVSGTIVNEAFGYSVAIDGDTVVIGDYLADVNGDTDRGAAYVFNRNEGGADNWGLTTVLTDTFGHNNDGFGHDVAVDHDHIVVGAPGAMGANGAVLIFYRNQGGADNWGLKKGLLGTGGVGSGYQFGYNVAISGDTIIAGSIGENSTQGASYIFRRNRGGTDAWGTDTILAASDAASNDNFGNAVAMDINSNTFLVAAASANSNQGKVYVFNSTGNFWKQIATPTAKGGSAVEYFGGALDISGGTLVVGAAYADTTTHIEAGEAYIYERNQNGRDSWGQVITLTRSTQYTSDHFGAAVMLDNDTAIVGVPDGRVGGNAYQGAAVIFERNQGGADNWGQVAELTASDGQNLDYFGTAVALDGDIALVGAPYADPGGVAQKGVMYVFARNQGGADNWGQVISITVGSDRDYFGEAIAISGDTAIVGVRHADPGGINEQGVAYIFERNQGGADNWGQVITLTEGVAYDHFGYSVDIDGDIAAVLAPSAKPDGSTDTGAVYIFERNQGGANNWGLTATLAPSVLMANDWTNAKVSISGDTIVVGAYIAGDNGKAYIFNRNEGGANNWGLSAIITSSDPTAARFGTSAAIDANTVVIGDDYADVNGNNAQGSAYVYQLVVAPDLSISKSVTPATANPGDPITYTLTYSNQGMIPAFGVVITDEVPITVTNISYSSSGTTITPTGAISYVWNVADLDVGDSGTITITGVLSNNLPAHTFANTAQIDATNEGWQTDNTASATLNVGDISVQGLTAANDSPALTGSTIHFTATITNGYNVSYAWNFGDGDTGTGATTSHYYGTSGVYTAVVTATGLINSQTATTTVTITDEAIAGLVVTGTSPVELGTDPNLQASVTAGSDVRYDWDFGNGETCFYCGQNPIMGADYNYTASGTYTVVVTASNTVNSLTDSITIEVTPVYSAFVYLPLVLK